MTLPRLRPFRLSPALAFVIALLAATALQAAPIRQVRAAWVVTRLGLDWPGLEQKPTAQRTLVGELCHRLQRDGFNTLYIEVQGEGDVLWPSDLQPPSADITGNGSRNLHYDAVRCWADSARACGLEVHAVVSPLYLGTEADAARYASARVKHPLVTQTDNVLRSEGHCWLDPSQGDVLDYLNQLYTPLMATEGLDGIIIDNLTAPGARPDALDDVVLELSSLTDSHSPPLQLALALPAASSDPAPRWQSLLADGTLQRVIPKLWQRSGHGFAAALEQWQLPDSMGRLEVPALMAEGASSLAARAMQAEEALQPAGIAVYRPTPQATDQMRAALFTRPAHLPVTTGADPGLRPSPPSDIIATPGPDGTCILSWTPGPVTAESPAPAYYTVYAARQGHTDITDPRGELLHRTTATTAVIPAGAAPLVQYAVTAFDACHRESLPGATASPAATADLQERPYTFRYYADNIYIAGPRPIRSVDIYNSQGTLVKHLNAGGCELSAGCSDLPGGTYAASIRYTDGSEKVEKFVK